jgi:hypothetical protein
VRGKKGLEPCPLIIDVQCVLTESTRRICKAVRLSGVKAISDTVVAVTMRSINQRCKSVGAVQSVQGLVFPSLPCRGAVCLHAILLTLAENFLLAYVAMLTC